jgi:hypothetical protein
MVLPAQGFVAFYDLLLVAEPPAAVVICGHDSFAEVAFAF